MLFKKAKLTLPAIVFLVLLRLAIGWHFFQEGAGAVCSDVPIDDSRSRWDDPNRCKENVRCL